MDKSGETFGQRRYWKTHTDTNIIANILDRCRRAGFTLVELLVVMAVIGVLVSLLLPAVQSAREATRRLQCRNNLKQIGLGLHHYHDVVRSFPPGWMARSVPDVDGGFGERWAWKVFLLPYLEQAALYDQLNVRDGSQPIPLAGDPRAQTILSIFLCPSDPGENLNISYPDPVGGLIKRFKFMQQLLLRVFVV